MLRSIPILLAACLAAFPACGDGRIALNRGPLGPASYRVELDVEGGEVMRTELVTATLVVNQTVSGAKLELAVADADPVVADLHIEPSGRLRLEAVQNVPPSSAGEADLASLVAQLDPPLPDGRVGLRELWTSTREITTDTLRATLTSDLRMQRFRRVAGADAAEFRGDVRGRLRASSASGVFSGTVTGTTIIAWALRAGRLASSETRLVWRIPDVGSIVVRTVVRSR